MAENDIEYHRAREAHCRRLANESEDVSHALIHTTLADLHRDRYLALERDQAKDATTTSG